MEGWRRERVQNKKEKKKKKRREEQSERKSDGMGGWSATCPCVSHRHTRSGVISQPGRIVCEGGGEEQCRTKSASTGMGVDNEHGHRQWALGRLSLRNVCCVLFVSPLLSFSQTGLAPGEQGRGHSACSPPIQSWTIESVAGRGIRLCEQSPASCGRSAC